MKSVQWQQIYCIYDTLTTSSTSSSKTAISKLKQKKKNMRERNYIRFACELFVHHLEIESQKDHEFAVQSCTIDACSGVVVCIVGILKIQWT